MLVSASLLPAVMLLFGAATAAPQATRVARQDAAATAPWVTIGTAGTTTVTPVLTTIDGTPTVISGAPADLTGSVFTETNNAIVTTSTGDPPLPTATTTQGAGGAFPVCQNADGQNAPFCLPATGDTLNPGKTYYITWDPSFFPASNTTVNVLATYVNTTIMAWSTGFWQAGWGFAPFPVDSSMLQGQSSNNISITMKVLATVGSGVTTLQGPVVVIANPPVYHAPPAEAPTGPALYIGLPTILGFVALVVIGTCLWNYKNRRIGLGNIMSRSRHGYASGKNRTERMGRRRNKEAIRLMDREVPAPEEQRYRDVPAPPEEGLGGWDAGWHEQVPGRDLDVGLPRRDSDALGSLAGTPTEDRHMDFHRPRKGNAFRDEISRQDRDRV